MKNKKKNQKLNNNGDNKNDNTNNNNSNSNSNNNNFNFNNNNDFNQYIESRKNSDYRNCYRISVFQTVNQFIIGKTKIKCISKINNLFKFHNNFRNNIFFKL